MRMVLVKTSSQPSKYGGTFYYAFFRDEKGKSHRSCIHDKCRNFSRWVPFLNRENVLLDGINLAGDIVDADSMPVEVKQEQTELF